MEKERFYEIMNDENIETKFPENKDNALAGLNLISKYLPTKGVEGAGHEVIYSADVSELVEAGITEEDAIQLRTWNWMIDPNWDSLSCFV